ncbi:kinesin-domain-containing protein [Wolfiporia cocos MD-104 SS10]|uniref:Kinesin-like protein n=1 Tax=Wolfiporia cocos (strain MD-104) TaxID=742152 RepID=A0A2H3JF62_WOLCO|nr:kinesin-domain-containing protein [Wolfiporia cocos MD-104 SS10]
MDEPGHYGADYGKEDKVLVSIRIRPTDAASAWRTTDGVPKSIKLDPQYAKSAATPSQEFQFDEILIGSDNKPVYNAIARSHVNAAMDGYNAVIFAYGQTASGKTFTLTGDEEHLGIIPRAMKDIFAYIRRTPAREYLLRCSYLEIYNEAIHDLLAPPSSAVAHPVQIQGAAGGGVLLAPLREEVVTSLKGVHEVLRRGARNRRTASTDWNERSSRSHSVFRVVIESRERGGAGEEPAQSGRMTPGTRPPTPGGAMLQARAGRSVQMSVLSLIDLAGSEKATSDKERTREGKYINTSLLTLGTVISTLAENAAKNKSDHIPYRNSKLTRMLQPSLSGDARISVICTLNPDPSAIAESTSTLLFAQRIKRVQLHARKTEVVDTEALLEQYRAEIDDLRRRLAEREKEAPELKRRLSAREQMDESRATKDINTRIKQLTKLILTSQTVDEMKGDQSRPESPTKSGCEMSAHELQQELLAARRQIETQSTQILSLEAALLARPRHSSDASESDKDDLLNEQTKASEPRSAVKGYGENANVSPRATSEDVEREWAAKLESEIKRREEKEARAEELMKQLEKEKKLRMKLEVERHALTAFVKRFDALGLGNGQPLVPAHLDPLSTASGGAAGVPAQHQRNCLPSQEIDEPISTATETDSPLRISRAAQPRLLGEHLHAADELRAGNDKASISYAHKDARKHSQSPMRNTSPGWKENVPL